MLITIINVDDKAKIAGGIESSLYNPYIKQNARIFVRFYNDHSIPEHYKTYSIRPHHEWMIRGSKSILIHGQIDSKVSIEDAGCYNLSGNNDASIP
tara:strand:+ start:275 stop:562 length:288 start_codon:yes stop_codon:yes gene_type:complete